jgi:hypothetical protein
MQDGITVTSLTRVGSDEDHLLRRLGFVPDGDDPAINDDMATEGDLYTFTATTSANTGTAWIHIDAVAIEWGGDPQWYSPPRAGSDREIVEAALNGDLAPL